MEIIPGERWEDKILASLASSKVLVAVFSSDNFLKGCCKLECNMVTLLKHGQRGPLLFLPLVRNAEAAKPTDFIERALIQIQTVVAKPH